MKIKITRAVIEARKQEAAQANAKGWNLTDKPIVRSYFNPANPSPSKMAWLGVKVLHKRTGRDTESFHKAYAMG
jgi:hypothetical protein